MLRSSLVLAAVAVLVITLVPATRAKDDQVPARAKRLVEDRSNDVYETRFLLITLNPRSDAANGIDLRLRHVIGDRATDPDARFFVVNESDPEKIVANLRGLGDLHVLDRSNLPLSAGGDAKYSRGFSLPVPQEERRENADGPSTFVRMKFEQLGTKVKIVNDKLSPLVELEASFALAFRKPLDYPIIATTGWNARLSILPGQTAVFRNHYRLPAKMLSPTRGERPVTDYKDGAPADLVRMLVVLLTRSSL
jgi:hypothetical protein